MRLYIHTNNVFEGIHVVTSWTRAFHSSIRAETLIPNQFAGSPWREAMVPNIHVGRTMTEALNRAIDYPRSVGQEVPAIIPIIYEGPPQPGIIKIGDQDRWWFPKVVVTEVWTHPAREFNTWWVQVPHMARHHTGYAEGFDVITKYSTCETVGSREDAMVTLVEKLEKFPDVMVANSLKVCHIPF